MSKWFNTIKCSGSIVYLHVIVEHPNPVNIEKSAQSAEFTYDEYSFDHFE